MRGIRWVTADDSVEAPVGGTIKLVVSAGETVLVGELIAVITP